MEKAIKKLTCCIICLKTNNDSQLISVEANTADAIIKLFYVEIANTGSGNLRICISCLSTVERAASLKDCLQNHGKFFTPKNYCPGCLKTAQSELQPLESASSVDNSEQRNEVPNRIDHLKCERVDDCEAVRFIKAEVSDDDLSMPTEGDHTSSSSTADLIPSVKGDRGDAKTSAENVNFELLLATTDLKKEVEHAPEIEWGKVDAMDDFINYNVVEDLKSEGSSKEVAEGGVHQSEGPVGSPEDLTCHCGFKAVSAEGFSTHQRMKHCKPASLQVRIPPSYEPMVSLPGLYLLESESEVKWELETAMHDDEERGLDSSTDEDKDEDASPDYVANSVAGDSTSRYAMKTRRRSRPQRESNFQFKSEFAAINAVDITAHRLCDKKFECDNCYKVFDTKKGILMHMRIHIKPSQERKKVSKLRPFACSYAGCQKSYVAKNSLLWHQKTIHTGPRLTSVNQQQKSRCASTDPAMNASTVLTSAGNVIERAEEDEEQKVGFIVTVPSTPKCFISVKAPPTFECGCGYKTKDFCEFNKHYEVCCPR